MSYPDIVLLMEGKPVIVPCPENRRYKMSPEDLDAAIRQHAKEAGGDVAPPSVKDWFPDPTFEESYGREEDRAFSISMSRPPVR